MSRPVAFYAPLKPPGHPVPSGDRRMARLLIRALRQTDREVELASRLRAYDRDGDAERQARIQRLGERQAARLIERFERRPEGRRPGAWITYHGYHKSPDWLGPAVSAALGLPYLLIETSFAPKQAGGPWAAGHAQTRSAIRRADLLLAMTAVDQAGLAPLVAPPQEIRRLPPFLDHHPFAEAAGSRCRHRAWMARRFGLDPGVPWLLAVGMMRADVKSRSYALLAATLAALGRRPWQLLIIGDGPARPEIEANFRKFEPKRVMFAGILGQSDLAACYAAADVYAWPAVREAYGLAMLEAAAAGLPVAAGNDGGVAEVVQDGVTGLLCPVSAPEDLAAAICRLLDSPTLRDRMRAAASEFVARERSLDHAAMILDRALADAGRINRERCR
jgi:glycosyltransferase involved in cell wall biosynthesis